ncbi:MAG: inorganic pyrophosphatase [Bacteroidales bacterium]
MADTFSDPIGKLMGLRYKSHPWHGVHIGDNAPDMFTAFIEIVTTDTVKFEIDKSSGYLKLDRPQKYSNVTPALYGFIPQTYCGRSVGEFCMEKTGREGIKGDGDPIDVCVLTEKNIAQGNFIVEAIPIGGFRMLDGNEADDKIIAVLKSDVVYGEFKDISECPNIVVERLKHYFLTYKDMPGKDRQAEITHTYEATEAKELIRLAMRDYRRKFENLGQALFHDDDDD